MPEILDVNEFEEKYKPIRRGKHAAIYEAVKNLAPNQVAVFGSEDGIKTGGQARGIAFKLKAAGYKASVIQRNGEAKLVVYGK